MKKILAISVFIIMFQTAFGQSENPREQYPHGISLYGVGPNLIGSFSYDYFITPHLNANAGVGFMGVHAGMNVHFWGGRVDKRWTPYVGAFIAWAPFDYIGVDFLPYFPIGIHYLGKNRFQFAFEIAPLQLQFQAWNVAGVKLGYRF